MKPKITSTGSLNDIHINLASDGNVSSMPDGLPLATVSKLNFTDLYLKDTQSGKLPTSRVKARALSADVEPFRNISFTVSILSHKGFFKEFFLCMRQSENPDGIPVAALQPVSYISSERLEQIYQLRNGGEHTNFDWTSS